MILYTHSKTARLQYIVDFISQELSTEPCAITTSINEFTNYDGVRINYSNERIADPEIQVIPQGLLSETGIRNQTIDCFELNGNKAFFATAGDLSFDIFAASFYLLSRYEEYLPHDRDIYGRYAHKNSLAFKEDFLTVPLVNIWISHLRTLINQKFTAPTTNDYRVPTNDYRLSFLPTYDIDIAWSYKHKGWWRNFGGGLRSLIKGEWSQLKERVSVLRGRQADPFDAFEWMDQLHQRYNLKPRYFFLIPERRGRYDKNNNPSCEPMKELIRQHSRHYPVGIHPSWNSGDNPSMLKEEIERLSTIADLRIDSSRQHYIRFNLPEGYRRLITNSIRFDYSMGYGSINGFRASVCSPFLWYDLEKEVQTDLLLFPFCYMEANSFYEQKFSAVQALDEMRKYYQVVKAVNGQFIMIWHNSFLGTDPVTEGWRDAYEKFIREVVAG